MEEAEKKGDLNRIILLDLTTLYSKLRFRNKNDDLLHQCNLPNSEYKKFSKTNDTGLKKQTSR